MPSDIDSRIPALELVERTLSGISGLAVTLKPTDPGTLRTHDLPLCQLTFGRATRQSRNVQLTSFSQTAQLDCIAYMPSGSDALAVERFVAAFGGKIDGIANEESRAFTLELTEIDVGLDTAAKLPSVGFSITVGIESS